MIPATSSQFVILPMRDLDKTYEDRITTRSHTLARDIDYHSTAVKIAHI